MRTYFLPILMLLSATASADVDSLRGEIDNCKSKTDEAEIRACLGVLAKPADKVAGNTVPKQQDQSEKSESEPSNDTSLEKRFVAQWHLSNEKPEPGQSDCWRELCGYRPSYAIFRNSNAPNVYPSSDATSSVDSQPNELKFQISLKSMLWRHPREPKPGETGQDAWQIWAGYTQQSHWQIFNGGSSRPFRDTNYEPEAYLNFPIPREPGDSSWIPRMVGIGMVHQSNGQSNPLSRSWNRTYVQAGFAGEKWTVLAKGWKRWSEGSDDDNPGIENYLGRGELTWTYALRQNALKSPLLSLRLRHSLNRAASHGSAQLEMSWPVQGSKLNYYFQAFRGYGESMLDYNHQQTSLGVGLMFADW